MPATEQEIIYASILYYHAYEQDFPLRDYRKQGIEYIIEQLKNKLAEGMEPFSTPLVH